MLFLFLFFVIYRRNFMPMQITAHAMALQCVLHWVERSDELSWALTEGLCDSVCSFDFEGFLILLHSDLGGQPGAGADPNKSECNKKPLEATDRAPRSKLSCSASFFFFFSSSFWGFFFGSQKKMCRNTPPPLNLLPFFFDGLGASCLAKVPPKSKVPFLKMALPFQILNSSPE